MQVVFDFFMILSRKGKQGERTMLSTEEFFVANVPLEHLQDVLRFIYGTRGSGLVRFPSKMLSHFFTPFPARQKDGAGRFAVCGRRPGTLSLDSASLLRKA